MLSLKDHLVSELETEVRPARTWSAVDGPWRGAGVAIVGMAGRFPASRNIEEFWRNLCEGRDCISRFTHDELLAEGVNESILRHEHYVPASGVLEDIELFDARFFGISPREAESMDPQQRIFLEVVQHALDDAGCDPGRVQGAVGVYAGCRLSQYWLRLLDNHEFMSMMGWHQVAAGNDKDFLATQTSFRFNLRGPSVNVQAACSTSLLAVSLACDALVAGHCDVAVAGGSSVAVPHRVGYVYQPSGIASPDGKCRPFDAGANGSVLGSGVAAVVLKRLTDAILDGDRIYAVIRSAATNNDGKTKSSFAAPSVQGQAEVVAMALQRAGITPEDLDYIEAHGTATSLGDPIEVAALARVFAPQLPRPKPCLIGSVKGNVGHLDPAAGVAALIKTALSLQRGRIPPSIHFERPNPSIDFESAGIRVATECAPWPRSDRPRRAGVSSFGIGGTNVHAVLEEAPLTTTTASASLIHPHHLLIFSAKSAEALRQMELEAADYLEANPQLPLDSVAFTLSCGRQQFQHRSSVVASTHREAAAALRQQKRPAQVRFLKDRELFFLFPGQGTQHLRMGLGLYRTEPQFRNRLDEVARLMIAHLGYDLRALLMPEDYPCEEERNVERTEVAQPLLFAVEYATASLWMHWGVHPQGMLGHSVGELVAACASGVMSLEDAARVVCARGRLMQQMTPGAMIAVGLDEEAARAFEEDGICLAAMNGPKQTCIAASMEAVLSLEQRLKDNKIEYRRLKTSHAFHHPSMRPASEQLLETLRQIELKEPQIPFVSNLTGDWITPAQAVDPEYWAATIVAPVRFSEGVLKLMSRENAVLIECGPARTLTGLILSHPCEGDRVVVSSLSHPDDARSDLVSASEALATLWRAGVAINWENVWKDRSRQRVTLPGYAFQRTRHWIDAPAEERLQAKAAVARRKVQENCYAPAWQPVSAPAPAESDSSTWLIMADSAGPGLALCERLAVDGRNVIAIVPGEQYRAISDRMFSVGVRSAEDFRQLAEQITPQDRPVRIVNCWTGAPLTAPLTIERGEMGVHFGFIAPAMLFQALMRTGHTIVSSHAVTCRLFDAVAGEIPDPTFAPALGLARVLPQEMQGLSARLIDVAPPTNPMEAQMVVEQIKTELTSETTEPIIVYRGKTRLTQAFNQLSIPQPDALGRRLREGGTYLITGGFGGIGGVLARLLASTVKAQLVLVGRRGLGAGGDAASGTGHQLVRELEALGATVLPLAADVSEPAQVEHLVRETHERFGPVNGVIHAAGVPGGGMMISRDMEAAAAVFAPKVRGTIALLAAVAPDSPDFFALCSSFAAIGGGVGQGDYCGANAFMDAVAHYARAAGLRAISINWPAWNEVGMAAAMSLPSELEAIKRASLLAGINPTEGAELFAGIVAADLPQVVVAPFANEAAYGESAATSYAAQADQRQAQQIETPRRMTPSTPPQADSSQGDLGAVLEQRLAGIWSSVLGIEAVLPEDNFFEIGGQSLMALQIVSRIREQFTVEIDLSDIFEKPTLREFAAHVESRLIETVAAIPEEKVREMLAANA